MKKILAWVILAPLLILSSPMWLFFAALYVIIATIGWAVEIADGNDDVKWGL